MVASPSLDPSRPTSASRSRTRGSIILGPPVSSRPGARCADRSLRTTNRRNYGEPQGNCQAGALALHSHELLQAVVTAGLAHVERALGIHPAAVWADHELPGSVTPLAPGA